MTLPTELPGTKFGYNFFKELPPIEVGEIIVEGVKIKPNPDMFFKEVDLTLPLKSRSIRSLQAKDAKINNILQQLQVGDLPPNIYLIENGILRRRIVEPTGNEFKPIVIPKSLVDHILMTAHNHGGYNGFPRMYAAIRHLYFWVGMKKDIQQHCKRCQLCTKHNIAKVKFEKTHFKGARQPMQFVSMDLIGEFHPPSQQGQRYALTIICMHTSYVFCIPLKIKTAEEVVQAYLHQVYNKFGGSEIFLSHNSTEFKNKLFKEVASQLGIEYKVYTPLYRFHKYLKSCVAKHIINNMEWDEFTDLATTA